MGHIRGKGEFKLDFVCVKLTLADGNTMRAVVLAVSEIRSPTHIMAGVALENGTVTQMPIRRDVFLAAQVSGDVVTFVEAPDQSGKLVLLGEKSVLDWDRSR